MMFDISGWKYQAQRDIYLISRPFNLLMLTSVLAMAASISAIVILKFMMDIETDNIRSYPHDPMVLDVFGAAREVFRVLSFALIILTIIVAGIGSYIKVFRNDLTKNFNQYLISQYKTDSRPAIRMCFVLLIAVFVGALLLPYIAYLLASPWPLLIDKPTIRAADKRWIYIAYNISWFWLLVLIPIIYSALARLYKGKAKIALKNKSSSAPVMISDDISLKNNYGKLLFAIFFAWLLYGPPWNISSLIRPMDSHIFYTIASYQAINSGYMPYIGPASFLYGPGTQLIVYLYQVFHGDLGLISFRESYAFINWLAATIYFSFGLIVFGKLRGAIIIFLSVIISPLIFFQWREGILAGLFGWSNALRYIAIPIVTILVIRTVAFFRTDTILVQQNLLIGIFWGLMTYIAQENGVLTLVSVISVLLIALSSNIISLKQTALIIASLISGVLIIFGPILIIYLMNDGLLEFVQNFRKMPTLAFRGLTNIYWHLNHYANYFFFVPAIALLIGVGCFLKFRPFGFIDRINIDRLVLLAVALVVILTQMSAIIHTADTHVVNSMIGIPIFVTLLLFLPLRNGAFQKTQTIIVMIAVVSMLTWLIPAKRDPAKIYPELISSRIKSFSLNANNRDMTSSRRMNNSRLPETIRQLDECCNRPNGLSGRDLENIALTLKEQVGELHVHIDSFPTLGLPGILLYIGDIQPAPTYKAKSELPTVKSRIKYRNETLERLDEINTLVTADLSRTIPDRLLKRYPDAHILKMESKAGNYYIIDVSKSMDNALKIKS